MSQHPYIHNDFMLQTIASRRLYHEFAAPLPIIDYHCHLPPADVAADRRWDNLGQLWLGGDHYKWRAMRSNGIDESRITGAASDRDKFQAFAETMPYLLRNPLFDWAQLELARYFGITQLLSPATADEIWEQTTAMLAQPGFSARGFMTRSNVEVVCTTDDPVDSLEHHRAVRASGFPVRMLPSWRPDKALLIDRPAFWNAWLDKLAAASGSAVDSYAALLQALERRHAVFHDAGCRLSDYGLETVPDAAPCSGKKLAAIFDKVRAGGTPTAAEAAQFRFELLVACGRMDAASDWTWQIHYGALRNTNTRLFEALGPDVGCDSIGDFTVARAMARLFDRLDRDDVLPRTIVYTLNPRDNELLGTMIGNFQRGPVPGKIQFGSGWWFNDQKDGMSRQLEALSQLGLLSRFVGMLTDSRSFLSYTRHEYFRRILCNLLGTDIAEGKIPNDIAWTGEVVKHICFRNAVRYFKFTVE